MSLNINWISEKRPQTRVHYFDEVASTMTEAAQLAAEGAAHGTVVMADTQTAGVGRFGRHWLSEPGVGIYCSIILRLPLAARDLPVVTLALGLATQDALEQETGLAFDLRWPNDVLADGFKVAGILTQLHESAIVAGIGINVAQESLPSDLRTPAASLRMLSGHVYPREPIVIALLDFIDDFCSLLTSVGPEAIIKAFVSASSYAFHRRIVYESEEGPKRGVTMGLDEHGFLLVRDDDSGVTTTLYNGGIRPDQ